jgi:transposase
MVTCRRQLLSYPSPVCPSIEATMGAIGKHLDEIEAQIVGHVREHHAQSDKLMQ